MPLFRQVFKRTRQLSTAIKDVNRLREVVGILLNHGFGYLLEKVHIPGMGRIKARREAAGPLPNAAERARAVLIDLGPTAVKIGQILSTRPDLVPPSFIKAFQSLQDDVPPMPLDVVRTTIRASLKGDPEELFARFEPQPLASASIAQVHRATLKDGRDVVLKIQRPGVKSQLLRDLEILVFLARQIEYNFPDTRLVDLSGIVKEIERSIQDETNFLIEAANLERFARNFADDATVHIPELHRAFCTSEILTMEFLDGVKITKAEAAGYDIGLIGQRYLDASYKMLFRDGFFHGDLHPGNVIVLKDNVLGFIDFGMVGRLSPEMKDNVVECMFSLLNMDFRMIARIFWEIGIKDEAVSYQQFEADIIEVMERHLIGRSIQDLQMGMFFKDILEGAVRHRIRTPTGYTMLFKALVTTEGMAKMLVPEINPLDISKPYIEALIKERYGPERIEREYFYQLSAFTRLATRMPIAVQQLLKDIEERRLKLTIDLGIPRPLQWEIDRIERRRLLTAAAIAFLVCGTLTIDNRIPVVFGFPLFPSLFFIGAFSIFFLLSTGYPWRR